MKTIKYLFAATLLLFSSALMAQNFNMIIFSEDADRFFVLVNGVHQSPDAQSNIKITGLKAEANYKVKVIFQDNTLPGLEKNVYAQDNMEYSFNIKRNKKGVLKMAAFGFTEIDKNANATPNQYVVEYGSNNNQPLQTGTVVDNNNNTTNTTTTTTTTTNTVETNALDMNVAVDDNTNNTVNTNATISTNITETDNAATMNTTVGDGTNSVNMNISVSETGLNVNISENSTGVAPNSNRTYTETTTVTSTTTTNGQVLDNTIVTPSNSGNCFAMAEKEYNLAKASISKKDFDDSKMIVAKQIIDKNCLNAEQIKGFLETFDHEDNRLEFAKYAHKKCADPQNFYKVNDAFDFESTIEELDEYISGQ